MPRTGYPAAQKRALEWLNKQGFRPESSPGRKSLFWVQRDHKPRLKIIRHVRQFSEQEHRNRNYRMGINTESLFDATLALLWIDGEVVLFGPAKKLQDIYEQEKSVGYTPRVQDGTDYWDIQIFVEEGAIRSSSPHSSKYMLEEHFKPIS